MYHRIRYFAVIGVKRSFGGGEGGGGWMLVKKGGGISERTRRGDKKKKEGTDTPLHTMALIFVPSNICFTCFVSIRQLNSFPSSFLSSLQQYYCSFQDTKFHFYISDALPPVFCSCFSQDRVSDRIAITNTNGENESLWNTPVLIRVDFRLHTS